MLLEFIETLERQGLLKEGIQCGAISPTLAVHRKIYQDVHTHVKSGVSKTEAVRIVAALSGYSYVHVWKVLSKLKPCPKSPGINRIYLPSITIQSSIVKLATV